jgi:hypothetical protein
VATWLTTAVVGLDGRRVLFAFEVQRHLLAQARVGVDALEVDVLDDLLVRVHLEVAQQDLRGLAAQFHLEDGRVEGFLLQGEVEGVVIEFDHLRLAGAVDDAGNLAGQTQAAARSGPLQAALISGELHGVNSNLGPATRRPVKTIQPPLLRSWADGRRIGKCGSEVVVLFRKEGGDRFAVGNAADGLGEQEGHRQLADLLAGLAGVGQRQRVGDDDFVERRILDAFDGRAGEHGCVQ